MSVVSEEEKPCGYICPSRRTINDDDALVDPSDRTLIVDWMYSIVDGCGLDLTLVAAAMGLVDRFLSKPSRLARRLSWRRAHREAAGRPSFNERSRQSRGGGGAATDGGAEERRDGRGDDGGGGGDEGGDGGGGGRKRRLQGAADQADGDGGDGGGSQRVAGGAAWTGSSNDAGGGNVDGGAGAGVQRARRQRETAAERRARRG